MGFWRKPHHAVKDVNFEVHKGDIYGFVGPNGAGKSTTIKVLLGLLRPTSGSVKVRGLNVKDPQSRQGVGYLPESPYYYSYLTGREFLFYFGKLSGLTGSLLNKNLDEAVEKMQIEPRWLNEKLSTFSKGMLQRFGIAQAIISKPKLLILDEPTSGLDPIGRRDVREMIKNLRDEGVTIFYSSHILNDVELICNQVSVIVKGTVRQTVSAEEIRNWHKGRRIYIEKKETLTLPADFSLHPNGNYVLTKEKEETNSFLRWAIQHDVNILSVEKNEQSLEGILRAEVYKSE